MSTKVLGRIATVLSVNAKPLQSGLNLAKGELETFASTVKSRLTSAGNSAERALKGMYTDFQRLERAVKAANSQQLNLKVQNPKAILDVARATERIAKPVGDAQKQFSALSQTVQSALLPVLQSGQKQAENFFDAISRGVKVTERDFANTESRVNRMTEAIRRAAEASQATRGLATGQELRFQNPEFLRSTSRAAQLQQQAAQLSPEAISSRGIVSLIGQQKLAADEAERLRATLERTIATRNGDQESARRAYTQQVAYLDQVNARLERQIQLERQAGEINDNIGASTQLRSTTDPTGRSIQQRSRDIRDARINENVGAFSRRATDVRAYIALLEQERLAQEAVAAAERKRSSEIAGLINREKAALELERERIAAAKKAEEAEQAALNRREQTALRLERQLADDSTQRQQAEQDTLNRREQNALRLERQLADEARRRQDAEQAALNKKEQTALRLERQLADEARRREEAEQAALNRREQTALRLERQLTEEARRRQEDEQAALNRREQTALRLEKQLADAARQRQEAEDQAFQAFIRRQQAAKSLEQNLGGGISPPTPSEVDDTARLINRERARLEAERNRISPPTPDQNDETARLIARERAARDEERMRPSDLTGNRDPRTRVLGQLGQEVGDLRNRLGGVGATLAGELGPTVDNLTTRFQNMARQGIRVSADEARRLAQEVAEINASLNSRQSIAQRFESSFGGAGRAGLSLGVDERSLRGIGAQIEFVQGRLSTLRQEVRGPVIAALDAFRVRSQQLFEGGEINTDAGRRQLRLLQDELARTLSAAGGGSVRRINEQLRRVGDIARGSFGNVGLAIQQAIFAFDDFFSVTGGLDQRIRAAGNNISQLGFILGGTAGLIGGVLVSALAQAAAGLVKWANSGAGSVEIAKALNERLERQKSLLGEITSGFNELADGVGENAFSEASRRAADFEARLTSVIDKLKEFRDSAATALNADVFMADGVVESRQGRLREAGTLPLAAARQALLRDAERSADQARVRARSAPAMSRQELQDAFGGGYTAPAGATNEMLRGTLEERQSDLARVVDSWFYTFIEPFEQANARRQIVIVSRARDNLVAAIASNIEQITRGVVAPAARRFDATANRAGEMLGRANEVGRPSGDVTAARDALEVDTRAFRDALTRLGKAAAAGRETEVQSLAKFLEALSLSVVAREREARALLAAANASARFVEVLGRLREANDAIFGDISNVASQARRDALQAAGSADSGLSRRSDADFAQARSDRLQQELRAAEDRRTAAESALRDAERRFRFESPDQSIRQLVNEAASLRSIIESPQTAPQAAASARQRELFVNDQLNRAFASSPMGRALQDQVDEAARAAGSVLARDSMITQGRELSMTPGQRTARELEDNLSRINAFFDDEVQRLGFPFQGREEIEQRREEARRRLIADQMRNAAPTIFGLADSVANAVLQGPSRAALQATDVSTVEGSRELTRLLRGDDAARDQANLVELQREANRLLDIIANAPAPVAN